MGNATQKMEKDEGRTGGAVAAADVKTTDSSTDQQETPTTTTTTVAAADASATATATATAAAVSSTTTSTDAAVGTTAVASTASSAAVSSPPVMTTTRTVSFTPMTSDTVAHSAAATATTATTTAADAASVSGDHDEEGEDGVASASQSDVDSDMVVVSYKRKKRRPAVTEEEDMAILRAIATVAPHSGPRNEAKRRWQRVAQAVVADIGTSVEITNMLCQRRYEILLNRFVMRRELHKNWPENPELRALLEAAVAERKAREDATATVGHPSLSLDALRAALAGATANGGRAVLATTGDTVMTKIEPKDDKNGVGIDIDEDTAYASSHAQMHSDGALNDLFGSLPASQSPTNRRSFVESTLVAVLDRITDMEKTWLANAREERQVKLKQLEMESDEKLRPTSTATFKTPVISDAQPERHDPPETEPTESKPPSTGLSQMDACDTASGTTAEVPGVKEKQHTAADEVVATISSHDTEVLKTEVARLIASVAANKQTHDQISEQVGTLSTVLDDVKQEKDVLRKDVATLQALLRDAASLAGTLKLLRDSHQQHEEKFETFVLQHDARMGALRLEVEERHQLIHNPLELVQDASSANKRGEAIVSIQKEREELEAAHRKRLAELDEKITVLDGPVSELKGTIDKHQQLLTAHEVNVEASRATHATMEQTLKDLKTAIEGEQKERLSEYGTLLHTIEQVVAGKAKLI